MAMYDKSYLEKADKERLKADIGNDVYQASGLFERLEGCNRIIGSGHELRQALALYASKLLEDNIITNS